MPELVRRGAGTPSHSKQVRAPQTAPNPDAHFVVRREESERLTALMLKGENAAVGITAALRGASCYAGRAPQGARCDRGPDRRADQGETGLANVTMAAARLKETIGDRSDAVCPENW